jgi:branched-chain amino acid transport system permease protein
MSTQEILPPPAAPQKQPNGRERAQNWWKTTSSAVRTRWRSMPRPARIVLIVLFVVFLYALPLRGFYLNFGIPLPGGGYLPLYTERSAMPNVLFFCTWIILLTLGLNIVVGYAGLLDLGFFGFFALGAYTVALLTSPQSKLLTEYNWMKSPWPWLAAVPVAIAVTTLSGGLLGWPTLRLRGDYLAIVTLGFAEMILIVAKQQDWILNGDAGIPQVAHPPGPAPNWYSDLLNLDRGQPLFSFDATPYYWLSLTVIIGVIFLIRNLERSRVGRAWIAIREDEDAAELMGVPTFRFKLWAFAMGASIGGLSGAMWAGQANFVNSGTFTLQNSILVLAALLLGGAGNIGGAILGGFMVVYVPEWLRTVGEVFGLPETMTIGGRRIDISVTSLRFAIFGAVLIVMMIFRPQGIWPNKRRAAEYKDRQKEGVLGD